MSVSTARTLIHLLIDQLVVQDYTGTIWPCYLSSMPDKPDQCATIIDRPSNKDGRLMDGTVVDHPGAQIMVRSQVYQVGWDKIKEIERTFDRVNRTLVAVGTDTMILHCITRPSSVLAMGSDPQSSQRREYFSLNVFVTVKPI